MQKNERKYEYKADTAKKVQKQSEVTQAQEAVPEEAHTDETVPIEVRRVFRLYIRTL